MKTIGALLYLFENNNKQYKIQGQAPIEHSDVDNTRVAPTTQVQPINQ
jgi:hypothetical protein